MIPEQPLKLKCPGCGIIVQTENPSPHPYIGANAECWEYYGQVLAKEYQYPEYFLNHRLTVDAYAIQHPGVPERRSIQSVNVHLISLAMLFNLQMDTEEVTKKLGNVIDQYQNDFKWLNPPKSEYKITILDVLNCTDSTTHCAKVKEWALHVWETWGEHHISIQKFL